MTFTYDITNNIGKVRREIDDTIEANAKLSDEEISYFLARANSNVLWATVYALEALSVTSINSAGTEVDVGDIRVKNSNSGFVSYSERAKLLRKYLSSGIYPDSGISTYFFASGIYQDDRDENNDLISDGTLTKRSFWNNYNDSDDPYVSGIEE